MRQADILSLLPRVVQRSMQPGDPLDALLSAMEGLHASTESTVADSATLVRPWQAPEPLLPYLASWLDLDAVLSPDARGVWQLPTGDAQLRTLLDAAVDIARWRGTRRGLILYLESATGLAGYVISERVTGASGAVLPFTIRVIAPAAAQPLAPMVQRIVETAKPAYVQAQIVFAEPGAGDAPSAAGAEAAGPGTAGPGTAGPQAAVTEPMDPEPPWAGRVGPPSAQAVPLVAPAIPTAPSAAWPVPAPPASEPPSPGAPHA